MTLAAKDRILICGLILGMMMIAGCGDPRPYHSGKTPYDPNKVKKREIVKPTLPPEPVGNDPYNPALATATFKGVVLLAGESPTREKIASIGNNPQCAAHANLLEEDLIAANGKLKNVVVYVVWGAETRWRYTAPTVRVEFDQVGCQYLPHVAAAMVDQTVRFKNSDSFQHNVHYTPEENREDNIGQGPGQYDDRTFSEPELPFLVKCDIHKWMVSYLAVFRHPFFVVTGDDGTFEIKLPPGEYKIATWHETLERNRISGGEMIDIVVGANETKEHTFKFEQKQ